ncbi:unnamed protein product, partial [Gongylonema pulchrum]|uniref:Thioredoxin_13 domain-containing protein n=1 Tax=Gongylonema pulchrum TaxID=637853 RepID=A0A183D730_9BILA
KTNAEETPEEYADNEDIYGFNFNKLRKLHGNLRESLDQFRLHLLERDELTPLKVWQVQELSYQAAQRIVQAGPEKALSLLTDVSQNFPLAARSLSRQVLRAEMVFEIGTNQEQFLEYGISEGESLFLINGIIVDVDALDAFQDEYLSMLTDLEPSGERLSYALDFRPASP